MSNDKKARLVLFGAAGRMGRVISCHFLTDNKVQLTGAIDPIDSGKHIGTLNGLGETGPVIVKSPELLPRDTFADIALDFSIAPLVSSNAQFSCERGWDVIIGVTGISSEQESELIKLTGIYPERRIVVVPNFTLGVNLLMKFAKLASEVFNRVEIIEYHHDRKADAPSGTALHTARIIADNKSRPTAPTPDDRSRGRIENEIPIHAVRLPGLLAHQEVIFGSTGEVLTIRHDTTDRSAFLSGIYMAIGKLPELPPGFIKGLDWAIG